MQHTNPEQSADPLSSTSLPASPMKDVAATDSSSHVRSTAVGDGETGRWALGVGDVGVQGAMPGRGVRSHPNEYASHAVQTDVNRERTAAMSSNQGFGSSSGTAATLLLAANTLAQTPAQSVSNALLGQVQMVAAAAVEQGSRRSSLTSLANLTASGMMSNGNLPDRTSASSTMMPLQEDHFEHGLNTAAHKGSGSPLAAQPTIPAIVPQSPRSAATFQVGSIATHTAAQQYLEQILFLDPAPEAHNLQAAQHLSPSTGHDATTAFSDRRWDENNPFQGVPSLPLTPSASLAMLPPPDVTRGMATPLTPEGSRRDYYFQPTYRLAPDEYEILASAAAIATVALTTATTDAGVADADAPPDPASGELESTFSGMQSRSSRPLSAEEQEEIASTLRAWAGLEGAERQEEARNKLQQRQTMLKESDNTSETRFFPPDFARHYKSQLTALAAGYYQSLHSDGLTEPLTDHQLQEKESITPTRQQQQQQQQQALHAARSQQGPHSSGSMTTANLLANTSTSSDDFQRLQRVALDTQTQARAIEAANKVHADAAKVTDERNEMLAQQQRLRQEQQDNQQRQQAAQQRNGVPAPNDAMQLIANASQAAGLDVTSPQVRDHLLQYAHKLYANDSTTVTTVQSKEQQESGQPAKSTTTMHPTLLPLLHTLHNLHPEDLPTLLLLSCAYYSSGDLPASLWYNKIILRIDPNYVESMSNIGTTLRALGRWREAESWWWRAIKLRPGYWDAYENLLGVLCAPQQSPSPANGTEHQSGATASQEVEASITGPRFDEALKLCEFVESHVFASKAEARDERVRKVPGGGEHPICMPSSLPFSQAPRLQNLLYAKGNLKYVLTEFGSVPAAKEYQKAVEMMLSPSEQSAYSLRDLVLATYVVGILTMGVLIPGGSGNNAVVEIAQALGLDANSTQHAHLAAHAHYSSLSSGGVLRLVRDAGDTLVQTLLRLGGGQLPILMLVPEATVKLTALLFAESGGYLPAIVSSAHSQRTSTNAAATMQQTLQQASSMTSTILLTLSKLFQDSTGTIAVGPHGPLTLGGIPASVSLLLPLYYLSISLNPSASTANNLGILLSSIPAVSNVLNSAGQRQQMNGQTLALQYYTYGLQLDPKHPHLYTNFGSLLKDLNHLTEAVQMYEKAIECNPDFDVALANLGNAIKDQGRTQDSVQYYRRAVRVNPNFPEALCGLVNALLAVCDWGEVYGEDEEGSSGFMKRVRELLEKQLEEGSLYGARAVSVEGTAEDWVNLVVKSTGDSRPEHRQYLKDKFDFFYDEQLDRKALHINEGSFVIRLVERLLRRTQRRWYLDRYVAGNSTERIEPTGEDVQRYTRIPLPSCLVTPVVPTVLPFHTFTLKITPRHIRLISHRNALRISQTTLTQLWLPPHVYPPPRPPHPKIKVGYVSSDFNNHPLAHLMQSVFGFHDLDQFDIHLYATTVSDQSPYRAKIEKEAQHFTDVSTWSNQDVIRKVLDDGIHILMNLNGYTKGARNEIFAARPCPVQMEFMGFAGGLASGWTDWIVVDPIVCPPDMTSTDHWRTTLQQTSKRATDWKGDLDPEDASNEWVYTEKFIYLPDSYFVNDHRQGFREPAERAGLDGEGTVRPHEMARESAWAEEEERRWRARKEMWPSLPDDYIIFSDFNQLYKLEPTLFKLWLRILKRVPNSILWLLRFPAAGEAHLLEYAHATFGPQVASRVIFTEVAPKGVHIHRGRIADLFLDTLECGAHTTSADILWSATPVLTWPKHRHKMASRVAASIVEATGLGDQMIVKSEQAYEDRAVELAKSVRYRYVNAEGKELQSEAQHGSIRADALEFNKESTSAMPHCPTVADDGKKSRGSNSNTSQRANKEAHDDPAPANVKQAAAVSEATASVLARRKEVTLPSTGEKAPAGAASRRGTGELIELRRSLFLGRDKNRLFDTKRWVHNLERGYKEAWRRYVDGTDTEESEEWARLPADDEKKQSGHIWLRD